MAPQLFGIEHILYIIITTLLACVGLLITKKYAITEKSQKIVLKCLAVALFITIITNRISQVYRYDTVRWYCTFFGFTAYLTLGAFLMQTFHLSDAFHIAEPLFSDSPLTAWVMAPMYAVGYGIALFAVEIIRKRKNRNAENFDSAAVQSV